MMPDAIDQFRDAIRAAGIEPPETIEPDGVLHRFAPNGKANDDSGWYTLHLDHVPAGAYGDWRSGVSETWSARKPSDMSATEREQYRCTVAETKRQRDAERERGHAEARKHAARIWRDTTPETGEHRYLRDKGVEPHGIRSDGLRLVIPMRDADGTLHSIQHIDPRGDKRYLAGGRVSGCYHAIGKPNGVLCVGEGYATGASIHEATGHGVAVAFNAGNLEPVALALRRKHPDLRLECADDDYRTDANPGTTKATAAARAVGGLLAVPDFGETRSGGATDFNDLARCRGLDAVRDAVARATAPAEGKACAAVR